MVKKSLIIISAPSGAGKTTLCEKLLKDFPELKLSISSTTRAPRGKERDGVEYFFLAPSEFESKIQSGDFVEWAQFNSQYYGTSQAFVEKTFAAGHAVLLDIDVQGAEKLYSVFPNDCLRIFIAPPDMATLAERLRARKTDSEEKIQSRLKIAEREMRESKKFDAIVVNDSLARAYEELKALVAARLRSSRSDV